MKLQEVDWNAPGGAATIEVEYPDALIAEFVNWVRKTRAWVEYPETMESKVRQLNNALGEHRAAHALAAGHTVITAVDQVAGVVTVSVADKRRASLAKARAAKAAKKLQEA